MNLSDNFPDIISVALDHPRTTCPNPDVNVNMRKETVKFSEVEFLELMVEPNGEPVYHDPLPQVEPFSKFIKNEIKSETLSLMRS